MYNGQIGQGCPHIEVNNVDYQLHDIDHFNYNLYNFYNKNIFFRGPHNIDINNDKFFVSIGAAQSFGRAVKNDFNSIIEQNINLKHINMGIGGVGYEFYNNKFLLNIINKAEFVIINTMSPRSINFDNYISNGSVNFHIPETNSYLYWRRFYKEYLVNKGLTDDVISEKIYKNYFEQLLSLIKKINSEIIFIYLNTKGNNENIEIFPQYFNKKYLENLKKIVGNYISVSSENYKNELRSYYPNQLSNEIVSRLILKYLNLKNNYLFSHFKLSQSYKYINDLINSDNYKEFILSKFNVDDSINENAELLIPKIIHQTGPDNYKENELSVKSIESFKSVYNDWEHKFWTDNDIEKFIKDEFEWFYDCWKNLPYPIMKFDAVRYCWLYKFGGMYTDIDTEPGIRNDKYLTGKEVILIINREKIFNENRFDELHVDNWWMCSSPNQEIWLDMIHYIKNYNHNYGKHFDILYRTGPYGLGLVVANYIMKNGDEKIKFLSRDKSNALLRESRTDIDKTYLIVHRSEGSWAQKI